jgi:hypothetical protein
MTMIVDDSLVFRPGAHHEGVVDRQAGDHVDALALDLARQLLEARQVFGRTGRGEGARQREQRHLLAAEEVLGGHRLGPLGGGQGERDAGQLVADFDGHGMRSSLGRLGR